MTLLSIRGFMTLSLIVCLTVCSNAQPVRPLTVETRPYKILTSGKQVTVKSSKNIKNIMVWTASGHRIVEQQEINASSYSFTVNINEKYFFVMIQLDGMKPLTEKIGVQQ